ncbi:OmpA family protein [Variovorax saccharolyticus]|uniref:OmpA family protein n=1 Tax=Variovorax saccharolyticus TaxID=3053516 RepID=UPI002576229C|nr:MULTISPECIES: OmpA family protein [unclassified Variovorax]MDM0019930.1 OmpA family protein [Variovorax sp. J22R187]MDM0027625.1 OmpA family protein [Variovorax sp. J31P216]
MKKFVLASCAAALVLTGCAGTGLTDTQRNTGVGAGVGALAGAAIGSATGGRAGTGAAVGALAGAAGGYLWSQRMENQKRQMEAATKGTGVAVTQTANNELKLAIPSDISFDVGRSAIKPNFSPVLDQFASGLRNNPNADVRIIGHTDSTGTDAINNPLSIERAASTRDYLVARGVPAGSIRTEGRGSREPIADNNTDAGRAQNRRVEIYVGERPQG